MSLMKKLDEIKARQEKACTMITALCVPKGSKGSREWIMSIPAEPDYDPDIVICDSLKDLPELEQMLRKAYKIIKSIHDPIPIDLSVIIDDCMKWMKEYDGPEEIENEAEIA